MPANAVLIAVLIIDRPLCAHCISRKSGLAVDAIESYLSHVARQVPVNRSNDRCRACGEPTEVVSISGMVRNP
jgi:hypothetical protein